MKHTASFSVAFPPEQATAILQALEPEASDGPEGTTTQLALSEAGIQVDLTGETLSGLRAAMNSVLRLMDAAARID